MRIDVGIYALKGFAKDGISRYNFRIEKVVCSDCHRELFLGWGKPIYGRFSDKEICSAKCTNAKNSSHCSCSCGGKNHAKSWNLKTEQSDDKRDKNDTQNV
jgi:hypothetical protein